jgi:uncharacterized protein (UPF0332 family)
MFHAARALLYSSGYRERSHRALITALRELFVKTGKLEEEMLDELENAMSLREEADYGLVFSEESAKEVIRNAGEFINTVRKILKSIHQTTSRKPTIFSRGRN